MPVRRPGDLLGDEQILTAAALTVNGFGAISATEEFDFFIVPIFYVTF
jgi:hypothetical protein